MNIMSLILVNTQTKFSIFVVDKSSIRHESAIAHDLNFSLVFSREKFIYASKCFLSG